jgi:iron(III) transport system substrate-binding protein
MLISVRPIAVLILILWSCMTCPAAFAASDNTALLKAKQDAESRGYVFFASHEEIVSKAKTEGKLLILAGLEDSIEAITEAFKRSRSIDLHIEALKRPDDGQRVLLEVKAGAAKNWDIARVHADLYTNWLPHLWKVDLLGMAEHGVLDIPPTMIDSKNRNVIGLINRFAVVAYNRNLVSPAQVPQTWEDMLKPEWKGRKFGTDVRPQELATLVPAWGLEKTLDYARKIAAQEPIWGRSAARPLTALASGDIPLYLFGANYGAVTAAQRKDPLKTIQFTILEPVPISVGSEQAILTTAKNPHAALLWLEFMAGAEGQKLIDQHEPLYPSRYSKGSAAEQALRGKKLSVVSLENNEKLEQWIAKLTEAYGFPTAAMK